MVTKPVTTWCSDCHRGSHAADLEYLISGLVAELEDGLGRLERADAADDHVGYYREHFDEQLTFLRSVLASGSDAAANAAYHAIQASFFASIWPTLDHHRRHRGTEAANKKKMQRKNVRRARCLHIAASYKKRPSAAAVRVRYLADFPKDKTPPSERTIRGYLAQSST